MLVGYFVVELTQGKKKKKAKRIISLKTKNFTTFFRTAEIAGCD
jgi:hypothetical protein